MTDLHHDVAALCQLIGAHTPLWTQGAGGNVSVKRRVGNTVQLAIKASGARLDAVTPRREQALLPLEPLQRALEGLPQGAVGEAAYAAALCDAADPAWGRPSMETGFHALLPGAEVLHFHSVAALLLANLQRREPARVAVLLQQLRLSVAFLPYVQPGLELMHALQPHKGAPIVVLANHGVILQGDAAALLDDWRRLEQGLSRLCGWETLRQGLLDPVVAQAWAAALAARGCPARPYFPDSAVFWQRLQRCAADGAGAWRLDAAAAANDRDAAELLQASAVLAHLDGTLDALPDSVVSAVLQLPTEQWRSLRVSAAAP